MEHIQRTPNEAIARRLAMKERMDSAMSRGALTLATLRSIPPTTTSIEHHTSLMKRLKAQERHHGVVDRPLRITAGLMKVEVPSMTVGDLMKHVEADIEPVRRSSHIGNQPAMELAIMAGLPPGVDVLLVDTIQGNDRYSRPNQIIRVDSTGQLISNAKSNGRVVGSLQTNAIGETPEPIIDIHQRALDSLPLRNRPVAMMKYFSGHPEILGAVMTACVESAQATRHVQPDGKIERVIPADVTTIYGFESSHGVLLPLNGMMAMDALISHEAGSDSTLHLAGPDMIRYTLNATRMGEVNDVMARACAHLGVIQRPHRYRVLSANGLGVIPEQSQHQLLETGRTVDLSPFENNKL